MKQDIIQRKKCNQNLMNNNDYLTGINDPENSIKYDTLGTYNE